MGKRKKSGGDGHGGSGERWLLTYADLITLLVAFFVVMYAISQTDAKKYQAVATAMQSAFNQTGSGGGKSVVFTSPGNGMIEQPNPQSDTSQLDALTKEKLAGERIAEKNLQQREEKEFKKAVDQISKYAQAQGITTAINMVIDERGLVISIQDTVFFETGKSDLQPGARDILEKVAKAISTLPNQIRIEGHTDNVPINTVEYPDNWRLSTDRAVRVLQYFQDNLGFKPERLSAAGYGEYKPKADNNTEAGRALNRRVDIVILRSSLNQSNKQDNGGKTIEEQLNLDQSVTNN